MSLVVSKPAFCICEINPGKDADQLRGNSEANQRLCTISLLSKFEISSLYLSFLAAQSGLCKTLSETPKTGFLKTRLKRYKNKGDTSQKKSYDDMMGC